MKYLWWCFFAKIVNHLKPLKIFAKKLHHRVLIEFDNAPPEAISDIFKISFTEHYGFATSDHPENKIVLETLAKFRKVAVIFFFNSFIHSFSYFVSSPRKVPVKNAIIIFNNYIIT